MKVTCLSIINPISYLIVAGIKDVENRTWTNNYRGTLYIHSSGDAAAHCYVRDYADILKIHAEFDSIYDDADGYPVITEDHTLLGFDREENEFFLTEKGEVYRKEYELIKKYNPSLQSNDPYFKSQAIIGTVELVDVIRNSDSPFAAPDQYHWILANPVMFERPFLYIKGRLKLFECELPIHIHARR